MKKLTAIILILLTALIWSCGGNSDDDKIDTGETATDTDDSIGFEPVEVGDCIIGTPKFTMKDKISPVNPSDYGECNEFLEVKSREDDTISFEWFGEFPCGGDWVFGYEIRGVQENVLKVQILEHDTDPDLNAGCDECCHLMPMNYKAESAEALSEIKAIEITYPKRSNSIFEL